MQRGGFILWHYIHLPDDTSTSYTRKSTKSGANSHPIATRSGKDGLACAIWPQTILPASAAEAQPHAAAPLLDLFRCRLLLRLLRSGLPRPPSRPPSPSPPGGTPGPVIACSYLAHYARIPVFFGRSGQDSVVFLSSFFLPVFDFFVSRGLDLSGLCATIPVEEQPDPASGHSRKAGRRGAFPGRACTSSSPSQATRGSTIRHRRSRRRSTRSTPGSNPRWRHCSRNPVRTGRH